MSYEGTKDDRPATQVVTVTSKTKIIDGVTCVVVEDVMSLAGKPADKTIGYYAQDKNGNVWYFGEDVQELNAKGKVIKTEGWLAGGRRCCAFDGHGGVTNQGSYIDQ